METAVSRFVPVAFAAMLGLVAPLSLHGQLAPASWASPGGATEWPTEARSLPLETLGGGAESSLSRALAGALVGGVVAPALGGLVGHALAPGSRDEFVSPGLVNGVALGLLLGPPIGAYIGNQRQGAPGLSMLGATGGSVLLAYAIRESSGDPGSVLLVIPVAQIGLSAAIEYITGR